MSLYITYLMIDILA